MHMGERFYDESELERFGFKSIGGNVKIKRNVGIYFTENVSIGNNVRIDDFTIIVASKEPVILGSNINIASHCYIAGSEGFIMKDFSTFAPGVMVFTGSDDYSGNKLTGAVVPKIYTGGAHGKVVIERHNITGAGTIIFPDITIEEGVAVGALSLVNRDLEAWGIYAGIPVKRLKSRLRGLLTFEKEYKEKYEQKNSICGAEHYPKGSEYCSRCSRERVL